MNAGMQLAGVWAGVLEHLWQTTLVLVPVLLLARALRGASPRLLQLFWSAALLKVLVPASVLEAPLRQVLIGSASLFEAPALALATAAAPNAVRFLLDPFDVGLGGPSPSTATAALAATLLWATVAAIGLLRLVRELRRSGVDGRGLWSLGEPERRKVLDALRSTGVPAAAVRVCDAAVMPHARGWLRPRIVLPRRLVRRLAVDELAAVLLHEDAHRRRRDPLRFAGLRACGSLLFFYPLLPPLLARLRDTAELICDEQALRRGADGAVYARALARSIRLGLASAGPAPAAGEAGGALLRDRFERVTQPWRYTTMRHHRFVAFFAAALLLAAVLVPACSNDAVPDTPAGTSEAPSVPDTPGAEAAMEEFDTPPRPIETQAPAYPQAERDAGVGGQVVLEVRIDLEGKIAEAVADQEVEGHPAFTEASLEAIRGWRFEPARKDGEPMACVVKVPFRFQLD